MATTFPMLPKAGPAAAVNAIVGIGVTIAIGVLIVMLTSSYSGLVARLDRLEASNAVQNETLAQIHVQLDVINQRGTAAADTRLSSLEQRASLTDARIAHLEGGRSQ